MAKKERITLFLADDHVMVREGMAALLAKDGNITIVGQCGDGLQVIPAIQELMPDVIMLDITMPGLNGLDICRELNRKFKNIAVLIVSMHDNDQFVARALEYGASGYLLKESAGDQLVQAVNAVAKGDVFLGPGISRSVLDMAKGDMSDPYERLSTRERQVLQLIAEGMTNRLIAEELKLSIKTVDTHRMRLMRKLNIHDQTALVKFAVGRGIVTVT